VAFTMAAWVIGIITERERDLTQKYWGSADFFGFGTSVPVVGLRGLAWLITQL